MNRDKERGHRMSELLLIGDVHGKFRQYVDLVRDVPRSIQIGDYGVGFPSWTVDREILADVGPEHRFIRGNHDNPSVCRDMDNCIPDGHYDADLDMFFVGGALSIDSSIRQEGVDYWHDEELSYGELCDVYDKYVEAKPRIMITHDVAEEVALELFPFYKGRRRSVTRQAFQAMFEAHRPELWVFGHWHRSAMRPVQGTMFRCLAELNTMRVEV